MDQVGVPGEAGEREVIAVREQRIERLDPAVAGVAIAGGTVDLQADARLPGDIRKSIAGTRAGTPGANLLRPDRTRLPHRFEIPVEARELAGETDVEHVALLGAPCIEEARIVALIIGIIR